jgi:hypothetical protein
MHCHPGRVATRSQFQEGYTPDKQETLRGIISLTDNLLNVKNFPENCIIRKKKLAFTGKNKEGGG